MFGYLDNFSDGIINDGSKFKLVWNNNLIWLTNYIKIDKYERDIIIFKVKDNRLIIEGDSIFIKMLNKREVVVSGKFNAVYLEKQFVPGGDK